MDLFFIQEMPQQVAVFDSVLKAGGVLSLVLLMANIVQWRKNNELSKSLVDLNTIIRKDAVESVRVIESLSNTIRANGDLDKQTYAKVDEILIMLRTRIKDTIQ